MARQVSPYFCFCRQSIQQVLDGLVRRQDDEDLGAEDERVDGAVLLGPFLELQVALLLGDQVQVPDQRERRRPGRIAGRSAADLAEAVDGDKPGIVLNLVLVSFKGCL